MQYHYFAFFLAVILFGCDTPAPETRSDRIANGFCTCTSQLLALNKQAAIATDSIDFEGIQSEYGKAKACMLEQRMKAEDLPEVQKSLLKKCPELAAEAELLQELLGKY